MRVRRVLMLHLLPQPDPTNAESSSKVLEVTFLLDEPNASGGLALSRYSASAVLLIFIALSILLFRQRPAAAAAALTNPRPCPVLAWPASPKPCH